MNILLKEMPVILFLNSLNTLEKSTMFSENLWQKTIFIICNKEFKLFFIKYNEECKKIYFRVVNKKRARL